MHPAPVEGRVRPLGRILSADEAALYNDAAGALAAARQEAERLRAAAQESAAAIRRQAEAETRRHGEVQAAQLLAETAARTLSMLDSLRDAIAEAIAAGVAQVIGTIDVDTAVAAAACHAVAQLRDRARVVVRVAPARVNAVRTALAPYEEIGLVTEDTALGPDDCTVETSSGFIHAGLSTQIGVLRQALAQCARVRPNVEKRQ